MLPKIEGNLADNNFLRCSRKFWPYTGVLRYALVFLPFWLGGGAKRWLIESVLGNLEIKFVYDSLIAHFGQAIAPVLVQADAVIGFLVF